MKRAQRLLSSLLIFPVLFSPLFFSASLAEFCNPIDKQALLDIKQSLGNPHVTNSWDPKTDCCSDWNLVGCKQDTYRVWFLKVLYDHTAFGTISPAVGNLTHLEVLSFSKLPRLIGTLPQTLTNLKKLDFLEITYNNIGGPIPEFLSRMTSLTGLLLSGNQFTGSVPPSLTRLVNLQSLSLDQNRLTGSLPVNYAAFASSIIYVSLAQNQLTGSIPRSFANGNFSTLDLSRNKLTGDASFLFQNPNLFSILINRNLLSFELSKVKFNPYLGDVDISHNQIYGNIPESMTKMLNLHTLNMTYNNLCGPIPIGGLLQSFNETSYSHNKCLCGPPILPCK